MDRKMSQTRVSNHPSSWVRIYRHEQLFEKGIGLYKIYNLTGFLGSGSERFLCLIILVSCQA